MSDKEIIEGNEPIETIENVEIEGHKVTVEVMDENTINIGAPEGLEGAELESFSKKAQQSKSLLATLNKKGYLLNQQISEQDEREKRIEERERKLTEKEIALSREAEAKIPSRLNLIMKHLELTDPEDLADVSLADRYNAEEKADKEITKLKGKATDNSKLLSDFIAAGGDYNEYLSVINNPKALINLLSKTKETKKPKFATTDLTGIQRKQIHIVKKGTLQARISQEEATTKARTGAMTDIMSKI